MKKLTALLRDSMFAKLPREMRPAFAADYAGRNNLWFFMLPFVNILMQVASLFIYLFVYPRVYPGRASVNLPGYGILSAMYIGFNLLFAFVFWQLRRREGGANYVRDSHHVLVAYLFAYICMESLNTIMEVPVSGNIYRLLASFVLVAFLPVLPRLQKFLLLLLYTLLVEAGFIYLYRQGYSTAGRYHELVFLFFIVCAALSNVVYSGSIKQFILRHELVEANKKLQDMIDKDPLTNLSNRRAFTGYVGQIWNECKRSSQPVSVLMIDIDFFKRFNDHYGHQKGDECLRQVAEFFNSYFTRSMDMVARYGGEEFIALLPYTGEEGMAEMAEGVRAGIEALRIRHEFSRVSDYVTISVGMASLVPEIDSGYEDLIRQADTALYAAKHSGRNRVCSSRDVVP